MSESVTPDQKTGERDELNGESPRAGASVGQPSRSPSSNQRISPEDCPVSEDQYTLNMLESAAMWLQGRSTTWWAGEFQHTKLMQDYAKFLRALRDKLRSAKLRSPDETTPNESRDAARYQFLRMATAGEWEELNDRRLSHGVHALDLDIDARLSVNGPANSEKP